MPGRYDAVIVGAGLSGLSLAAHLAAGAWAQRRLLVVDDGRHDVHGRAWAFWSLDPGWLAPAIVASWDRLVVHAAGQTRVLPLGAYRYHVVGGAGLHAQAQRRLAGAPGFEVVRGHVERVEDGATEATVIVDGRAVPADWVFDSRPERGAAGGMSLAFLGWDLEGSGPVFDPGTATFMDFRTRPAGQLRFSYVLPVSRTRALVEAVAFRWGGSGGELADGLATYVTQVWGLTSWSVRRTEVGDLPLSPPAPRRRGARVLAIGQRGGLLKSSTGYALERVQRDSVAIAASLDRLGHPFAVPAPKRRHAWLDAVLLDVIRREPDRVESAFARLFTRNPADRVLRFLDEDTTRAQEARLIATLPPGPFLRAAGSHRRPPSPP